MFILLIVLFWLTILWICFAVQLLSEKLKKIEITGLSQYELDTYCNDKNKRDLKQENNKYLVDM